MFKNKKVASALLLTTFVRFGCDHGTRRGLFRAFADSRL
jgi:hypothetical protein